MLSLKILVSGLFAIIVVGGGILLFTQNPVTPTDTAVDSTTSEVTPAENTETDETPREKKMPFSQFIRQHGSHQCTVNQLVAEVETRGTTYVHNGMIRGEYNSQIQGMSIDTSILVRDGYTYSWTSMMPNLGYKAKVVETDASTNPEVGTKGTYAWNAENIGDYECTPWAPDQSMFEIPDRVHFTEMP